jgi:hypothetical protein
VGLGVIQGVDDGGGPIGVVDDLHDQVAQAVELAHGPALGIVLGALDGDPAWVDDLDQAVLGVVEIGPSPAQDVSFPLAQLSVC